MKTKLKTSERIGIAVIIVFLYFILFSCGNVKSNQRKAEKHVKMAIARGFVFKCVSSDTITIIRRDTIVDTSGKIVITEKEVKYVPIPCPEFQFPKSNVQVRQEARTERAEIRNDRKENKQNKKAETKQNNSDNKADTKQTKSNNKVDKAKVKQEGKTDRKWVGWLNGLMLGLGLGIILTIFVSWWIGAYRRKDKKVDENEVEKLRYALEEIANGTEPYNEMEAFSFVQTAKRIAEKAINS